MFEENFEFEKVNSETETTNKIYDKIKYELISTDIPSYWNDSPERY